MEGRIQSRQYDSPARARFAINRSRLGRGDKKRLHLLVDVWERGGDASMPVVGALPAGSDDAEGAVESDGAEVIDIPRPGRPSVTVSLNVRCKARLTMRGVALLHEARLLVNVPDDLLDRGAVWEPQLWEFMRVFGPHMVLGGDPVIDGERLTIELQLP